MIPTAAPKHLSNEYLAFNGIGSSSQTAKTAATRAGAMNEKEMVDR
jgi:hypothetical protein